MILLDTTTRKLEVVLGGAITTNQLPFVASYVDITSTTFTPATNTGATNNTSTVILVDVPAASTQRQLKFLSIYNADTAEATITVRLNDNATLRNMFVTTLSVADTLVYAEGGWSVLNSSGQIKTSATGGGGSVSDTAFASSWNGVTGDAPSKNAVYDWGHTFDTDDDGKVNVLDVGAGIVKTDAGGVVSAATADTDYTANAFKTIAVSGQSDVVADSASDTLTLAAGSNMTLTTSAGSDTVTFASSGGGGGYWDSTYQVTGSDFSSSSTSLVDITGLSHAASASSLYEVEVVLRFQNSGTNNIQFGIFYSAAGATGTFLFNGNQSATTTLSQMNALGNASAGAYGLVATTNFVAIIKGIVVTGANTGNITVQTVHTTSGTTTVYIGSIMKIKKLA
jgi:hypothetical protein